jgi:hypothetical protein
VNRGSDADERMPFARVLLPVSDDPELVQVLALRGPRIL